MRKELTIAFSNTGANGDHDRRQVEPEWSGFKREWEEGCAGCQCRQLF